MSFDRPPRSLGYALERVRAQAAPATVLAAVQGAWPRAAGEAVAAQAEPVSERNGTITVACRSAIWAQELDLLQRDLLARLNEEIGEDAPGPVQGLRFTADAARHRR